MARTKKSKPGYAMRKAERDARAAAALAAPPPPPVLLSAEELLVQSAQHIGSLNYEAAKELCVQAVQKAHEEMQQQKEDADPRMLRDALEILGTIELELNEAQEAREVRTPFLTSKSSRIVDLSFHRAALPHEHPARLCPPRPFPRTPSLPRPALGHAAGVARALRQRPLDFASQAVGHGDDQAGLGRQRRGRGGA